MPRRSSLLTAVLGGLMGGVVLLVGCTSGTTLGSSGTVRLTTPTHGATAGKPPPPTSTSVTPVTPNGLVTGAGVDDTTISLGLLTDRTADRGFSAGVALWQQTVDSTGGICGRSVTLVPNATGESPATGYTRIAGSVLGLITMPSQADSATLSAMSGADQIPTLTLAGTSSKLTRDGPVVIGATEDIKAINAFAYLRSVGKLPAGSDVGVLTDSSPDAANALAGARWWAARNGVSINSKTVGSEAPSDWGQVSTILVMAAPAVVEATLRATASKVDVITNLDGYDPAVVLAPAGRLLVTLAAPAYGSDNPGAAAVAKAFVASGRTDPGPDLISGYGVGAAWGRLLGQACTDRVLTHAGVTAAMTTVGPASVDSLFGPSDPGLVAGSALPATRVSSLALADPRAPAGLRPLIWLQTAPGIADYVPQQP